MKLKKMYVVSILAFSLLAISSFIPEQNIFRSLSLSTQSYAAEEITGKCGDNLTYTIDSSGTKLTISGTGDMYNYEDYRNSDNVPPWSEYNGNITSLTLNDGITSIGDYAFRGTGIKTDIVIPDSVISIGVSSFNSNYFEALSLGNSVKTIKSGAFSYCLNLYRVKIPDSVEVLDSSVFANCSSLVYVSIGNSIKTIGGSAFSGCAKLEQVDMGASVETIDDYAFYASHLVTLNIGNSVKTIGRSAFQDCSYLITVNFGNNSVETIGDSAFRNCSSLSSVTLPPTVRKIGANAVFNNPNGTVLITSIKVEIGDYAFGLGSWSVNKNTNYLKEVQYYPYSYVSSYKYSSNRNNAPTVLKEVTSGNCGDNLTFSMWYNSTLPFSAYVYIEGSGDMYDFPKENAPWSGLSDKIIEVHLTNSITSIGDYAFYNCQKLATIYAGSTKNEFLPTKILKVGDCAFYGCSLIPVDITSATFYDIGEAAFYGCSSLSGSLSITKQGTDHIYVGENAFSGCTGISEVRVLRNGSEGIDIRLGSLCFEGIPTMYCFKGSVADKSEANLGYGEKKYIVENASLEFNVGIGDNGRWIHKVGIILTNNKGDIVSDQELKNYTINDSGYNFLADIYINEYLFNPLKYQVYYIYNYTDGDYDKEIAEGIESADYLSEKEQLNQAYIKAGKLSFILKEVE